MPDIYVQDFCLHHNIKEVNRIKKIHIKTVTSRWGHLSSGEIVHLKEFYSEVCVLSSVTSTMFLQRQTAVGFLE